MFDFFPSSVCYYSESFVYCLNIKLVAEDIENLEGRIIFRSEKILSNVIMSAAQGIQQWKLV